MADLDSLGVIRSQLAATMLAKAVKIAMKRMAEEYRKEQKREFPVVVP